MINAAVRPRGWLRDFLKMQMDGLTGHIEKAGYPYNCTFWGEQNVPAAKTGLYWWPFEQTAYHIDGYTRTAILLRDGARIAKAKRMIYSVIDAPDKDGYLGPQRLKRSDEKNAQWPHVVFFRACLAMFAYNHDMRIIDALTKHYLCGIDKELEGGRNPLNIEIILALYEINKNERLLDMAVKAYEKAKVEELLAVQEEAVQSVNLHAVTFNEMAKLGALLYRSTGNEAYLQCSVRAYEKVEQLYMLPGGCLSSSEYLRNNRYDEVYETCNMADMSWSMQYLAQICDEASYSDRIEKCVMNAGIGSMLEDFRGIQYFSCANQVHLDMHSSHSYHDTGNGAMRYAPKPYTECCTGNVNRIIPNYILSMWTCEANTITARMYGSSIYSGRIDGKKFSITEETNYPFELSIKLHIQTNADFTLRLRIPGWCRNYKLNGKECQKQQDFISLQISSDTEISLSFDAEICEEFNENGIYFTRGPLVYSFGMKGIRIPSGDKAFPGYCMYPDKQWNYAVIDDGKYEFLPGSETKWDLNCKLPCLWVNARLVNNWELKTVNQICGHTASGKERILDGEFTFTPRIPDIKESALSEEIVTLPLHPYGTCKLRITVFPYVCT